MQMEENRRVIAQVIFTVSGLAMVVLGVMNLMGMLDLGGELRQIVSFALIGAGVGDLVVSWFAFRQS